MARRTSLAVIVLLMLASSGWSMTPEERREYSKKFVEMLNPTRGDMFENWLQQTGELPPDFDALPKRNELPDPFTFFDGKRKVQTPQDWQDRRAEIKQLFEKYVLGTIPPRPKLDKITPLTAEEAAARGRGGAGARGGRGAPATAPGGAVAEGPATAPARAGRAGRAGGGARGGGMPEGTITKIVDLQYGPEGQIHTLVTLNIPPGPGPFPVMIGGGAANVARGYIACSSFGNVDSPPDIGKYYPEYDWGSMAKCAWTTSMAIDYLYTLPEVDKRYIAITGYSRGGKYATIATALDERITACVAGSTGVGGVLTWRQGGEKNIAESIESTTRAYPIWFAQRFRFFSGREDRLPVDGNLLVALIAPRSILNLYGLNDEVNSTWGNEQTNYDALKVYKFLGQPDRVSIDRIDGPNKHHGAQDPQGVLNWLDIQFGKSTEKWVNNYLFPWDYEKWKQTSGAKVDVNSYPKHGANELVDTTNAVVSSSVRWELKADAVVRAVRAMLGEVPSTATLEKNPVSNPGDEGIDDTPRWVIGRSIIEHGWTRQQGAGIVSRSIQFGPGKIRGDIYFKEGTAPDAKLPTVVFLHGNSYPLGYMWVYRWDPHPIIALANAGYAVLAFDQTGFGSRMNEAAGFYDKYPKWSQMGRMVEDTRAAVAAASKDPMVNPAKIYLFGYGLGGAVALHTAPMEPLVKGVVSICGYTPMRTDTADKNTGGIAQYSIERGIIPQLGFFIGEESRIPYDYHELIATIAPRPVYIFSPLMNRDATASDVSESVDEAKKVYTLYNSAGKLVLDQPWDYFRLSLTAQDRIVEWMGKNMN